MNVLESLITVTIDAFIRHKFNGGQDFFRAHDLPLLHNGTSQISAENKSLFFHIILFPYLLISLDVFS